MKFSISGDIYPIMQSIKNALYPFAYLCAYIVLAFILFLITCYGITGNSIKSQSLLLIAIIIPIGVVKFIQKTRRRPVTLGQEIKTHLILPPWASHFIRVIAWLFFVLLGFDLLIQVTLYSSVTYVYEKGIQVPLPGETSIRGLEGYGITHYNAHGEISTPFDDGTSVVVLGDSITEALQVPDNEKYVSVAETTVRQKGLTFNFHNLGKARMSIPYYISMQPEIEEQYHPEYLVIQLSPQDFVGADGGDSFNPAQSNYFEVLSDGKLEIKHQDDEYVQPWKYRLPEIVKYGRERASLIIGNLKTQNTAPAYYRVGQSEVITSKARLEQQLALLSEAYKTKKLIILLIAETPKIVQSKLVFEDPQYAKLRQAAQSIPDWQVIDTEAEFSNLINQGHFPRGFSNTTPSIGHLNSYGHQVVGKLLANKIEEMYK
jgi:hypothetical protein